MLAQNFKSAADLGITEPQLSALQKTLVLLETQKVIHVPDFQVLGYQSKEYTGHFNMRSWRTKGDCGTVRCIGGTACAVSGNDSLFDNWERRDDLHALFAPERDIYGPWNDITPAQAATALRSYLTTGDARWDLAVA